ncbi:alpha/beta hydrolase [Nocardia huaxiensis]|uniref:Alpha/beta hydrolase n=1 Tax=Nocardia huaxiensis TaxID=2755382 RepID=A0A7D6VAC9_9NOCA|nr:alpha/beta hydrolase [Nocardia huaxiensis]QLY30694.1 alpha/beta hydrolase [Nocardia huaxiensis]
MTEYLALDGGQIAYEVAGTGPLVVLSHGIGDHRQVFRFLAPQLVAAGYRVASADMRGHGESSMNWTSHDGSQAISRTDVAGDLLALIRHLGGPAVIIGHSLSGGAATIAAAQSPDLVTGVIELGPFTKTQKLAMGAFFTNKRYSKGMTRLLGTMIFKSLGIWMKYLDVAYPIKPADYPEYMAALSEKLQEPGRFAEFMKTGKSTPADAEAQLPNLHRPALIIMGALDPDFADPLAEAEAAVALMPAGIGSVALVEGAGHYPHAENPDRVAELTLAFLKEHAVA